MAAGTLDLIIEQGATFTRTVTVSMDLTGYSARMQVRAPKGASTKLIDLTSPAGGIVITPGALTSTLLITISASATAALNFKDAVYDLEIESGAGKVIRLLEGEVTLSLEVTR
jgi:hypothetical protein